MNSLTSVHVEVYCDHSWAVRGYRNGGTYDAHDRYCFTCDVHIQGPGECELKAAVGWLGDGPKAILRSYLLVLSTLSFMGIDKFWFSRKAGIPLAKKVGERYLVEILNGRFYVD